jgi:hypothetical protein
MNENDIKLFDRMTEKWAISCYKEDLFLGC